MIIKKLASARKLFAPLGTVVAAIVFTAALSFGVSVLAVSFTQPSGAPTNYNAPAPLDTSSIANVKIGGLILNTGGANNGLIVQLGNVGIGTAKPADKSVTIDNTNHDMQICLNGTDANHCSTSLASTQIPGNYRLLAIGRTRMDDGDYYGSVHCMKITYPQCNETVSLNGNMNYEAGVGDWTAWSVFFKDIGASSATMCMDSGGNWHGIVHTESIGWQAWCAK